jgi:hypothetical protein
MFIAGDFPGEFDGTAKPQITEQRKTKTAHTPHTVRGLLERIGDHDATLWGKGDACHN